MIALFCRLRTANSARLFYPLPPSVLSGAEVISLFALPLVPPQVHVLLFECAAHSAGLSVFGWY